MRTVDDRTRIDLLGGAAKVAELLGYDKEGGTQRVHNWMARGIPAAVKVQRPDLFMPELIGAEGAQAAQAARESAEGATTAASAGG